MKNYDLVDLLDYRVKYRTMIMFMFGLVIALIFTSVIFGQNLQGNITQWFDADTVQFRAASGKIYRIRLSGIDAPERRQTQGIACTNQLIALTKGKTVHALLFGRDSYKRYLGTIGTDDHPDLNMFLIEIGCAWEYSAELAVKTDYQAMEGSTRSTGIGLWADPCPTAPWEFRHGGYKTCP